MNNSVLGLALAVHLGLFGRGALRASSGRRPEDPPARKLLGRNPIPVLALLVIPLLVGLDVAAGVTPLRPSLYLTLLLLITLPLHFQRIHSLWLVDLAPPHPKLWLSVILLIGLGLRLHGIDSGLPHLYFDELIFVNIAAQMVAAHDLNPHWFGHPGTTTITMLSWLYAFIFRLGTGIGSIPGGVDFKTFFFQHPTLFYLSGRVVIAIFGVATLLLTYLIARRIFRLPVPFLAALLLALSPAHVQASRLIRTDTQLTFFVLAAFWFSLRILDGRAGSSYALAGLFTGLGVTTKYPAAVVAVPVVGAHLLSGPRWLRDAWKLALCGTAALVTAFAVSPFLFLNFQQTLADVALEAQPEPMANAVAGEGLVRNLAWVVRVPLARALMASGLVMAAGGVVLCCVSRRRDRWLLASIALVFLAFIAFLDIRQRHWLLPAIPFLCILAAHAIDETARWIGKRSSPRFGALAGLLMALVIAVPLGTASYAYGRRMSLVDTRTLASEWILEHIPAGSRILLENGTPDLPEDVYRFFVVGWDGELLDVDGPAMSAPGTHVSRSAPASVYAKKGVRGAPFVSWGHIGRVKDPQAIRREGIEYMVLSDSYELYRSARRRDAECARIAASYDSLMSAATEIYALRPVRGRIGGPPLRIYRLTNVARADLGE